MIRLLPVLLSACLLFAAAPLHALEVKETLWGFNGRVVPGRFNILSVRVAQPGNAAFDGELTLQETRVGDAAIGAPVVQPLYLTPGTERWVQFSVFTPAEAEWRLQWGRREKERVKLDAPNTTPPATVLLIDPTSPFMAENRLRTFSEELFPTTVAATDALDSVALDHVPRWEALRREAFVDWLKRGGTVHLLRGGDGFPIFSGDLAVLNTTLPQERVGGGLVVRHEISRGELTEEYLKKARFPPRELKNSTQSWGFGFDFSVLRGLAGLTKPEIAWWLIYLLTIAYLAIIGPLQYRWSKRLDYKTLLAVFLGTVAVFALAFIVAGRRGAGEVQIAHSISIARALDAQRYDVAQWISAFATEGDLYKFTHQAPANLYSATNESEQVNGRIFNGRDGHFLIDIPLYSSRPFLHRGVMKGDDTTMQVVEWTRERIELRPGADFPKEVSEVVARTGSSFITFARTGETWTWSGDTPKEAGEFFEQRHFATLSQMQFSDTALTLTEFMRPLIAHAIGGVDGMQSYSPARPLPADQLQLYIYATMPDGFRLQGKGFGREKGRVLYVQNVFRTETPAP